MKSVKERLIKKRREFSTAKGIFFTLSGIIMVTVVIFVSIFIVSAVGIVNPDKEKIHTFPDELGLYYEFYEIKAPNNQIMSGWFIPSQPENTGDLNEQADTTVSDRTVIFSHSYKDNKTMTLLNILYFARKLADAGYNVVMFDYSGSGSSTGSGYTFGTRETDELKCVIDFFAQRKGLGKFALAGWSFGAASAIMAGADDDRVQVIVADSPYADLKDTFRRDFSRWSNLPEAFSPFIRFGVGIFSGVDLYRDSPLAACERMRGKTVLLISGDKDEVFLDSAQSLYSAVKSPENTKDIWIVQDCGHMAAWVTEEVNYANKVLHTLNVAYGIEE